MTPLAERSTTYEERLAYGTGRVRGGYGEIEWTTAGRVLRSNTHTHAAVQGECCVLTPTPT